MNDADAEEFDKFVARHWGKESVFSPEEYKEEKKRKAAARSSRLTSKRKLATE